MGTYNEYSLQVPCLGRPMELGMLYDCRSENVIPGVTLWNKDVLQKNTDLKKREHSQFDIITEDTVERKAHSFEIEANAKLSFLCGMLSVEGSAKYLENKKSSHRQARVTLRYQCNTFFEQLTMDQLAVGNIQYKDVFDKGTATHVVTGVLYGVDAVFVFDRDVSSHEDCSKVEGLLKAIIKKIPMLPAGGAAPGHVNDDEETEINKFRCTFHGDLFLKENPTTFDDAVNVYRILPTLIQETVRSNGPGSVYGVPKRVYLYPLSKLDSRAARLVRVISADLVSETETLLETLSLLQLTANDLIKGDICHRFPGIRQQLVKFKDLVSRSVTEFQQKMADVLPKIRGGVIEEVALANKIKQLKKSPFDIHKLDTWIESKKQESRVIEQYLSFLKDCPFASQAGELEQHIHDGNVKFVLALSFGTIASKSHPFLEEMKEYLDSPDEENDPCESYEEHWFDNDNIVSALRRQAGLFAQFASVNKENSMLKCVVMASADRKATAYSPGDTFLFVDGSRKLFQPPSPPGPPEMVSSAEYEMELKWTPPESGTKYIEQYVVTYRLASDVYETSLCRAVSLTNEPICRVTHLEPNTSYIFKVAAVCEAGTSEYSSLSQSFKTQALPSLAERILYECKLISPAQGANPAWYMLPLTESYHKPQMQLRKFEVGMANTQAHGSKVMLVVGATGSGKTTLINGMVNYLFGVRFEDKYRLKLIDEEMQQSQAHSQTQYITAYTIHWQPGSLVPYSLTIIDTPGYGDTRGIEQDDQITKQIKEFFEMSGSEAIDQLDAVGFVAQASVARLTDTQKYVFDSILSIFGRDISDNIFMMLTFADGRPPPALDAIRAHKLPYRNFFKFNNSVFTQVSSVGKQKGLMKHDPMTGMPDTVNQTFDTLFWKLAEESFSEFFKLFRNVDPRSLKLTREVLDERHRLEVTIEAFQRRITYGVNHLVQMRQELLIIEQYEAEKMANRQFTRKVEVPKTRRHYFTEKGRYVTNCLHCNITCHKECKISDDTEKYRCGAMYNPGQVGTSCAVCDSHCDWRKHVNRDYYFEEYMEEEVVTIEDLKKKYDFADKTLSEKDNLLIGIAQKYNRVQEDVLNDIETVRKCLLRLDEIAMKRNPMTAVGYIDIMIRSAKSEKRFGWEQRLNQLENARKRAVMIEKMMNEGKQYDPFKELREEIEKETAKLAKGKTGIKLRIEKFFGFHK